MASSLIEVVVVGGGKGQSIAMPSEKVKDGFRPTQSGQGKHQNTTTNLLYNYIIMVLDLYGI